VTDVVPGDQIELIVGAQRHRTRHIARAVSAEQRIYIMHSVRCLELYPDLRQCPYSIALDRWGILDPLDLEAAQDRPVVIELYHGYLRAARLHGGMLPPMPPIDGQLPLGIQVKHETYDEVATWARLQRPADRPLTEDERRARELLEKNPAQYANDASDYGWSLVTGMCGGCGESDCHPDELCSGEPCRLCPTRKLQGFPSDL